MNYYWHKMPSNYYWHKMPRHREIPIFIDVPHAGLFIPENIASDDYSPYLLRLYADYAVHKLCAFAPELGINLLINRVSRLVIDVNRAINDLNPAMIIDAPIGYWQPSRYGKIGLGLIYDTHHKLTMSEINARINNFYQPYISKCHEIAQNLCHVFPHVIYCNIHSMPEKIANDIDFCLSIGDNYPSQIILEMQKILQNMGFKCLINNPYKGGAQIRQFANSKNITAVQIEINRKLYMNEKKISLNSDFFMIKKKLENLFITLIKIIS